MRELEELLLESLSNVLTDAAFAMTEPGGGELAGEVIEATISFQGQRKGMLLLALGAAYGHELATNLLGVDEGEELEPTAAEDAVGELANILGGTLLSELWPGEKDYDMGTPNVSCLPAEARQMLRADCVVRLTADLGETVEAGVQWM